MGLGQWCRGVELTSLTWYSPSGTSVTFSSTSETYKLLLGMRGFHESPEPLHQVTQAPFQNGATPSGNPLFESRVVTFNVRVSGPDLEALEQNGQYLGLILNPLFGPGTLVYTREDGETFYLTCVANGKCPGDPTDETGTSYKTTISLIAHDPIWYSYPIRRTDFGPGAPLRFPFKFPFKFPSTTPEATITNAGNVASPVTIVITGAIVNPVITRTYTDKYGVAHSEALAFTLTMAANEVLTITTGPANPTITLLHDDTTYDSNAWQYLNADPKFWQIQPGENKVVLTDASMGAGTTMIIYHTSGYTAV